MSQAQGRIEFLPTQNSETKRRGGKARAMLERLRRGPANTFELMMLGGAGFSSRIHELRVEGHRIVAEPREDHAIYRLDR